MVDIKELQTLKVDDCISFAEEKQRYTIQARGERHLICTKPFNARSTVLYTVVDLQENIRGTENLVFGLGAETREQCEQNKLPLFSFHTLHLKYFAKGAVTTEKQELWTNRVHLCRGHFKTFTEERPLFGKYSGMFWYQPQVRGDISAGLIQKDYQVDVNG